MSDNAPVAVGAREVFDRFVRASVANAWDDLADLYAPDAVVEIPWTPNGVPLRGEGGREEMRARFKRAAAAFRIERAEPVTVHETTDPDVVVAEFDLHVRLARTGQLVTNSYVMVFRTRDGLIVHSRDYTNPMTHGTVGDEVGRARAEPA